MPFYIQGNRALELQMVLLPSSIRHAMGVVLFREHYLSRVILRIISEIHMNCTEQ